MEAVSVEDLLIVETMSHGELLSLNLRRCSVGRVCCDASLVPYTRGFRPRCVGLVGSDLDERNCPWHRPVTGEGAGTKTVDSIEF